MLPIHPSNFPIGMAGTLRRSYSMRSAMFVTLIAVFAFSSPSNAAEKTFHLTVDSGKHNRADTPVIVPIRVPAELAGATSAKVAWGEGQELTAQVTAPGVHAAPLKQADGVARELHFVLPKLAAGQKHMLIATVSSETKSKAPAFAWHDTPGEYAEVTLGDGAPRPVLRYMCKPLDESSKEAREQTFKVRSVRESARGLRPGTGGGH